MSSKRTAAQISIQIKEAIDELKARQCQGPYFVVPSVDIRCFVPCRPGACICHASIDNRYCVVNESGRNKAVEVANQAISSLNRILKEVENAGIME